jgi:uncharacterized metal-binding protein YceD (DUF177 family)
MLFVDIAGLKSGKHYFEIESELDNRLKTNELVSSVSVSGELRVYGDDIYLEGVASSEMKLKCDLSLEDYTEIINADIKINIKKRQDSVYENQNNDDSDNTTLINDEQQKVDISDIVAQELLVNIPMKKVAPHYRDKEIEEIHPSIKNDSEKEEGQSPFDVLKKLNNN